MDLITKRTSAKDIGLPKWAKKAIKDHGIEDDVQLIRKGISPEDTRFKDGERSSVDYITTKAVDRDGEIVVPNGAVLDHYRRNPVVLFGHDYKSIPIGKSLWIKAEENGIVAKTQYASAKANPKADQIWNYRKEGFPMAKSIGFIPLETVHKENFGTLDLKALSLEENDLEGANTVYTKWLLLEYSDVPVPSNPEALELAISKGILTMDEAVTAVKKSAFVMEILDSDSEGISVDSEDEMIQKRYGKEIVSKDKGLFFEIADDQVSDIKKGMDDLDLSLDTAIEIHQDELPEEPVHYQKSWSRFKAMDGVRGKWNTDLGKSFDVDALEATPATVLYDLASKWLDCRVRDIFVSDTFIPFALMGTFLTGLEESLKEFELVSSRNFMRDGSEAPPHYDVIQLTSEKSNDFLVNGMSFYEKETDGDKEQIIIRRSSSWGGIDITAYSCVKNKSVSMKVFSDMYKWASDNNFLKGERFSLSGKFLKKTEDNWDSIFLSKTNEDSLKRTVKLLNEKGADLSNRGVIALGVPGTGKTLSGRIIMNDAKATFIWVSARDLMYSGASGGISYGYSLARDLAPSVLFIEDIDNWLHERATDLLKTEMDGIAQSKGIVTILTSNYPEKLPPALIDRPGRFHDILNFDLPDSSVRTKMLKAWAVGITEKAVESVTLDTEGFSGAHMYELVHFAKTIAEEEDIDIADALVISLKKIKDQRDLIAQVQGKKKELVVIDEIVDDIVVELSEDEPVESDIIEKSFTSIEKSGRTLSKNTLTVLGKAVDGMESAVAAIKAFIEEAETPSSSEDVVIEIEESDEKTKSFEFQDIDEKKLKDAITQSLSDILRNHKEIDVGEVVSERLNKAKGKVF